MSTNSSIITTKEYYIQPQQQQQQQEQQQQEQYQQQLQTQNFETWTPENKKLLREWAEKAQSYRWLHHRASSRYSHRSQILTILISVLSYISGGSVLSSNFDVAWFKYFVGYIAILSGILTNINGLVGWKQLSEKHKITSTKFSSFERSISSMLSINQSQRVDAVEFINIKRKEIDELITNAPNIPSSIVKQYEKTHGENQLSDFWVAFYYICCCHRGLRTHLLTASQRIEESTAAAATAATVKNNPSLMPSIISQPATTVRDQLRYHQRGQQERGQARASVSSTRGHATIMMPARHS